jgi:alpha-2-macroglobulin
VQRLLRSRLQQGGTALRFSTEDSDAWWWLMDGADANAARLLLAATEVPAWRDDVPRLVTGLLGRQQRGAWSTTTANLWGSLALVRYAQRFEAQPVSGRTTLQWGDVQRSVAPAAAAATPARLPWPAPAGGLVARHDGAGRPWLSVQAVAAVPLAAPVGAGYTVRRSVVAVQRQAADGWTRGDVMRVRLEIDAAADMAWVVISDPLPAGAAVMGSGLGRDSAIAARGERSTDREGREGSGWLAFEERAADAWRAYYEWLPRGRHSVEYSLRLNASGRFQLPPTRVEAMYAPDTFAESPNATLEVRR